MSTLIVVGDHDFTTTAHAAHAAVMDELIPGSLLAILPGTTRMQAPRRADLLGPTLSAVGDAVEAIGVAARHGIPTTSHRHCHWHS